MRNINYIFLLSFILFLCSCECTKVDCAEENPLIQFQVVDEEGENLVFGPAANLNVDDFRVFSVDDSDTIFINVLTTDRSFSDNPLIMFKSPDFTMSRVFIDYGDMSLDTLDIVSIRYSGSCCQGRNITSIEHNGMEVFTTSSSFFVSLTK